MMRAIVLYSVVCMKIKRKVYLQIYEVINAKYIIYIYLKKKGKVISVKTNKNINARCGPNNRFKGVVF